MSYRMSVKQMEIPPTHITITLALLIEHKDNEEIVCAT